MKFGLSKSTLGQLCTVIATAALPLGQAHAELGGSIWVGDPRFAEWVATAVPDKASPFEGGAYEKLNLAVLGNIIWVPKANQSRATQEIDSKVEVALRQHEAEEKAWRQKLGPIGGYGTN
jgi:hypothetical protein